LYSTSGSIIPDYYAKSKRKIQKPLDFAYVFGFKLRVAEKRQKDATRRSAIMERIPCNGKFLRDWMGKK